MTDASLKMTFDPMTIEHLGVRMYSTLPPVLGELIANSYDADANEVEIHLKDTSDKEIVVKDDGNGMSLHEINTKFLRIGRNRRENEGQDTVKGRKVIGKKGLGKLSFFGIAHEIHVTTIKDGKRNSFILRWDDIKNAGDQVGLSAYEPEIYESDISTDEDPGTIIRLRQIQRESNFDAESLVQSLARIFICGGGFKITVKRNDEPSVAVSEQDRYAELTKQLEWQVPVNLDVNCEYAHADEVKGILFTTEKPISPRTNMRGITLFSRNKLVNAPEYFSESTSSHFFSYLTGWLRVDFIDDLAEDVIGTNRQSLNWDHPEMMELRLFLQKLLRAVEQDWRARRKNKRRAQVSAKTNVDVNKWFETLPSDIKGDVSRIVESIIDDSELESEEQSSVVQSLHNLVPEYPRYHWRHLHASIRDASKDDYEKEDYYRAFQEAAKRFITETRRSSTCANTSDSGMMGEVYGRGKVLAVSKGFKKPDGTEFSNDTLDNIEDGQKFLSMGIVAGGRNPVAHEEVAHLRASGLFSEKDCLDGLSLLSHLMKRLTDAKNGGPVQTL